MSNDFEPGDDQITSPMIYSGALPAHIYCPPDGLSFDPAAYIPLPAIGVTATVVSFVVDDGFIAALRVMGNVFVGLGWTEGSGALVWQLLDNGSVVRNYDNIVASLGSVQNPRPIGGGGGVLVQEGHTVALTLQNVSLNVGGAQVGGRLGGWYIPKWRFPDEFTTF
jgi:hypothetical protein